MCNRKGARRRRLEAGPQAPLLELHGELEGYCPPPGDFYLGPAPYVISSKGLLVLQEDGLGNVSGRYVTTEVFNPPIPMNCN